MNILHVHDYHKRSPQELLSNYQSKIPNIKTKLLKKGYMKGEYKGLNILLALKHFLNTDIVHYHGYSWIWRPSFMRQLDAYLAKYSGANLFFTFQGSEVRRWKCHLDLKAFFNKKNVSVFTPDLLRYIESSVYIPCPMDIEYWNEKTEIRKSLSKLTVGYYDAPDSEIYIHQKIIPRTLSILEKENIEVDFKPCYGIPPDKMKEYYDGIDIYLDIRSHGWYGLGNCEAALRNVAPITFIPSYYQEYINSERFFVKAEPNPESLAKTIIFLNDENMRKKAVKDAQEYVIKTHSVNKVANLFLKWYRLSL